MSLLGTLGIGNPFGNNNPNSSTNKLAKQSITNTAAVGVPVTIKPRPSDFPDGFQIFEITAGKIPDVATISLIENRMPKVPFEYGGEQRIVKDYYPGNSEPVMHVLGPKETDVVISGRFYDKKFKGSQENYGASYALAQVLDGIRLRGNLCKFKMGVWVRYGFLEKTQFPLKRLGDLEYHLTLSISGFNLPKNAYFTDPQQAPFAKNQAMIALTQAHKAAYTFTANLSKEQANVKANTSKSTIDELNSAISDVATEMNKVTGFIDNVFQEQADLLRVANRALGLIKNAQRAVSQYKRQLGALNYGFGQLGTGIGNTSISSKASATHITANHILGQISAANLLAASLAAMLANIKAIAATVPVGRVRVQAGDTLQKIAAKNYGNADLWQNIYTHNNLSSTQLTPGQVLELPRT